MPALKANLVSDAPAAGIVIFEEELLTRLLSRGTIEVPATDL